MQNIAVIVVIVIIVITVIIVIRPEDKPQVGKNMVIVESPENLPELYVDFIADCTLGWAAKGALVEKNNTSLFNTWVFC